MAAGTRVAKKTVVKKYGNRRLYDTELSRYVTLEELEERIREGADVRVVDAKTSDDLTQQTLAQIILESRGASRLLPVPLLTQLIRMKDEALTEFLGQYLGSALELYLVARKRAQAISPYMPLATMPFAATNALARLWMGANQLFTPEGAPPPFPADEPTVAPDEPALLVPATTDDDDADDDDREALSSLRRELDALRRRVEGSERKRARLRR